MLCCGEVFDRVPDGTRRWSVYFGRRMTWDYHFPERGASDSYVLRSISVSPQPGSFEYDMPSKFDDTRLCGL